MSEIQKKKLKKIEKEVAIYELSSIFRQVTKSPLIFIIFLMLQLNNYMRNFNRQT